MAANQPKLLRAAYLADTEGLLRETRATALFYFPGPVFWFILVAIADWAALGLSYSWAGIGPITSGLRTLSNGNDRLVILLFGILTLVVLLWLFVRYLRWVSRVYAV